MSLLPVCFHPEPAALPEPPCCPALLIAGKDPPDWFTVRAKGNGKHVPDHAGTTARYRRPISCLMSAKF
ncbi:hypothetical protein [Cognatazoarcus halotolerans]|uniref:hypothetical protein n=1 Tax=Cognatazoarcus halotolerans TaxID=2686016 RepID=UPI00135B5B58|nr:hypothetical protein [Cognatazoarcus halotolerans]